MDAIQNQPQQIRYQQILKELSQQKVSELEQFAKQLLHLIERKKSPDYRDKESELIEKIRTGGPSQKFWAHYEELAAKSDKKVLTAEEKTMYFAAIEVIRKWDLEKLKLMMELGKLWNVSLSDVTNILNPQTKSLADV